MAVIAVPRPLREKLGEEGTDALIALINEAGENNKKSVIEVVEERFERRLAEEIGKLHPVDVRFLDRPDRRTHWDPLCLLMVFDKRIR